MPFMRLFAVSRFYALLCLALAIMLAANSLSSAIDQMQHAGGVAVAHEHMMFSDLSLEPDHADVGMADDNLPDHLPGTHHHHSDAGAGLPATAPMNTGQATLTRDLFRLVSMPGHVGQKSGGPERPPRQVISYS